MAEKDYANIEGNFGNRKKQPTSDKKSILLAFLAVIFVITCFLTGFYMGENHGLETLKGKKYNTLIEKLQTQQKELTNLKEAAKKWQQKEATTSQVGELTFYDELPKQSIIPEPINPKQAKYALKKLTAEAKKKQGVTKAVEQKLDDIIKEQLNHSSRTFHIQVASFTTLEDAQSFLPRLTKIGIKAEIQRIDLGNLGIRYRVKSEAFSKENEAIQVKQLIKEKLHMTGIMIQND